MGEGAIASGSCTRTTRLTVADDFGRITLKSQTRWCPRPSRRPQRPHCGHPPQHDLQLTLNTFLSRRALPLDLHCYLAIRKTALDPPQGRGGQLDRAASARNRGAVDIAMIGLMGNAKLRVSEAAALTWGDVRRLRGGSGRVRFGGPSWPRVPSGLQGSTHPQTIPHI